MIDIKEIVDGKRNGDVIWICDFRYNDYSNKPIRKIFPTKVLIQDNSEINKTIYYSKSHFIGLDKFGNKLKSKIISVFDNTGYRSFPGIPIKCFETEEECNIYFKNQCKIIIEELNKYKLNVINSIDLTIKELEKY